MPQLLRLWWSWTSSDECASAGPTARLTRTDRPWSGQATAGAFEAYSSEQRRGSSRAARAVEGARDTDKALGESQLSRPLMRAAATPSTGVCAPTMCRRPCTSALTRMLAYHIRLFLGRLFYTLKGYGVEFIHPEACLVVLVAGQRSQASLSARGAVNVLAQRRPRKTVLGVEILN